MKEKTAVISLIGRPNVGKSSLFNRLMKKSTQAITFDRPGVTRDRHYGLATFEDLPAARGTLAPAAQVMLVDTGGFYPQQILEEKIPAASDASSKAKQATYAQNHFYNIMAQHAQAAIEQSDLVLLVVDVREGVLPVDLSLVKYIRKMQKPFLIVANKADSEKQNGEEWPFYALGAEEGDLYPVSAAHGVGMLALRQRIQKFSLDLLPQEEEPLLQTEKLSTKSAELPAHLRGILPGTKQLVGKLAIIGAPNSGKSTLLNQLLGQERALVSPIPGTTVDPVEGHFDLFFGKDIEILRAPAKGELGDQAATEEGELGKNYWGSLNIVDTAGIRRKSVISDEVESQSVFRSLRCITDSDIVIYMVDSTVGLGHHDRRLLEVALEKGKSVIICMNKSDLVADKIKSDPLWKNWPQDLHLRHSWLSHCKIIPLEAKSGKRVGQLKEAIRQTVLVRYKKISTGKLNQCLQELVDKNSIILKHSRGKIFKIKYASMIKSSPPTFLLFCNKAQNIPENYRRYLVNGLRKSFQLQNTPIHLIFRSGTTPPTGFLPLES